MQLIIIISKMGIILVPTSEVTFTIQSKVYYFLFSAVLNNDNYISYGQIPTHSYLILDEESIYTYLNFGNIFLDIESVNLFKLEY